MSEHAERKERIMHSRLQDGSVHKYYTGSRKINIMWHKGEGKRYRMDINSEAGAREQSGAIEVVMEGIVASIGFEGIWIHL